MSSEVVVGPAARVDEHEAELAAFCATEYPRLVRALDLYCGDRATAEDLAQEALVRASQRWSKVRTLESPGGWTFRVAVNLANSFLRRRRAEHRANRRTGIDAHATEPLREAADRVAVRAALAGLTARQREAIVLRYFLDRSVDETAAIMAVPPSTVRSHTKRALDALRRELAQPLLTQEDER